MLRKLTTKLRNRIIARTRDAKLVQMEDSIERLRQAVGRVEIQLKQAQNSKSLLDYEAQVYSQNGEDGIIQRLIRKVPIERREFVEFGVESYREANTRFLLVNDNWRGLVLDGSETNIEYIRRDTVSWKHDLTALCVFVDRDNINSVLTGAGFVGDLGLLSVDIDGNDFWVWQAITCVQPRIVVAEYNATFGPLAEVTVPYDPGFQRRTAHHSNLFYGASLAALASLGRSRGYRLVGSNSAGNNAFFVREDVAGELPSLTSEQAFVQARFRESRDEDGKLTFLNPAGRVGLIGHLEVVDTRTQHRLPLQRALDASAP
jgi:hypothetical protein